MGSLKALFIASGVIVGMTGLAQAADLLPPPPPMEPAPIQEFSGWYLRGDVGMAINTSNVSVSTNPNPLAALGPGGTNNYYNSSMSASTLFDIGVGYQVNNWLRFDVTGEYRGGGHFQTFEQAFSPTSGGDFGDFYRGDVSSLIGLFNGYVDVGTWYGVTPFVGAGVGFANNRLSGVTDTGFACTGGPCSGVGGYLSDGSKTNLAWALMAGLDYNVTQNLKLELGYRFLDYGKLNSGVSNCSNGAGGFSPANCGGSGYTLATKDMMSSDVRLGLRWMFADAPVYEPAPQPLVRKY
jgi:opacity protein-like surface antigen